MPARRTRQQGPPWNVSLAEFRGAYQIVRAGHWWLFWLAPDQRGRSKAEVRHGCFIAACAICLPMEWHRQHAGRLRDDYYRARRAMLNMHRPIYRPIKLPDGTEVPQ